MVIDPDPSAVTVLMCAGIVERLAPQIRPLTQKFPLELRDLVRFRVRKTWYHFPCGSRGFLLHLGPYYFFSLRLSAPVA